MKHETLLSFLTESKNKFQNHESLIFTNFLTNQIVLSKKQIRKQTKLVKLVLLGQKLVHSFETLVVESGEQNNTVL